jgi:hypothetical protein
MASVKYDASAGSVSISFTPAHEDHVIYLLDIEELEHIGFFRTNKSWLIKKHNLSVYDGFGYYAKLDIRDKNSEIIAFSTPRLARFIKRNIEKLR